MSFLLACTLTACGTTARAPTVSDARTPGEAGLVDVSTIVGDLDLDIRYAGSHNFVGKVVDGYEAPRCYLLREPAKALRRGGGHGTLVMLE